MYRFIFVVIVAAIVVAIGGGSVATAYDQDLYDAAVAAMKASDFEQAVSKFELLVDESPAWTAGHVALGKCHHLLGRHIEGEASLKRARAIDPELDLYPAYVAIGQTLYKDKRFEAALLPMERALELAGESSRRGVWRRLAFAYLLAGRNEQARESLEGWRATYGPDDDTGFYLALACRRSGDDACAIETMREVQGERSAAALGYVGRWAHDRALLAENRPRRAGLLAEAVEDTRAWYRAAPEDPSAFRYYTETLLAANRGDTLIEELAPIARSEPERCEVKVLLARASNAIRKTDDAERWARAAAECDPASEHATVELAVSAIRRLSPEHTSLEDVERDLAILRPVFADLDRAIAAGAGSRARSLRDEIGATVERLRGIEAAFRKRDQDHLDEIDRLRRLEIEKRCRSLLWARNHEGRVLTADEEAYVERHDCKRFDR